VKLQEKRDLSPAREEESRSNRIQILDQGKEVVGGKGLQGGLGWEKSPITRDRKGERGGLGTGLAIWRRNPDSGGFMT